MTIGIKQVSKGHRCYWIYKYWQNRNATPRANRPGHYSLFTSFTAGDMLGEDKAEAEVAVTLKQEEGGRNSSGHQAHFRSAEEEETLQREEV